MRRRAHLTDRQARFCEEYLRDLNATQAAIRAGYSRHSAARRANELRNNPLVSARIEQLVSERSRRVGIEIDQVVSEIANLAFFDPTRIMSWNGEGLQLRPIEELSRDDLSPIKKIIESACGIHVVFFDKLKALELLGRHLGMFGSRVETRQTVVLVEGRAHAPRDQVPARVSDG